MLFLSIVVIVGTRNGDLLKLVPESLSARIACRNPRISIFV